MTRRQFLRAFGAVCAAPVAAGPLALLAPRRPQWFTFEQTITADGVVRTRYKDEDMNLLFEDVMIVPDAEAYMNDIRLMVLRER